LSVDAIMDFNTELDLCWRLGRTGQSVAALSRSKMIFMAARDAGDTNSIAMSLTQIGWFCLQLGHPEHGLDAVIAAKRLWLRCGNKTGEAHASSICSWLLLEMGLSEEAYEEAELAMSLAGGQEDQGVLAQALNAKACVLMYGRQPSLSAPLLERSLALVRGRDEPSAEAQFLINLAFGQVTQAEMHEQAGDAAEGLRWREAAVKTNEAAMAAAECGGDSWNLRIALCNGAEYLGLLGHTEAAHALLGRWEAVAGETGLREQIHYLYTLGELLTGGGHLAEALEICEQAVRLAETTTHIDHQGNTARRLAEVHEAMGNFAEALALHKRFHALYEKQLSEVTRRRAHIADIRLENGRLRAAAERLADEAARDGLTGLSNRRSFDRVFSALEGRMTALAILDLDFFKQINDRYSHAIGDAVLRRTAELLAAGSRDDFEVFRLGGEEFAVLLPHDDIAEAALRCEAIRADIEAMDWRDLVADLSVTVSIGLACGPAGSVLMAAADRRLYQAKAAGRNCIVSADPAENAFAIAG
jgi:diguanylate cyclase (GGDEF)-like protein